MSLPHQALPLAVLASVLCLSADALAQCSRGGGSANRPSAAAGLSRSSAAMNNVAFSSRFSPAVTTPQQMVYQRMMQAQLQQRQRLVAQQQVQFNQQQQEILAQRRARADRSRQKRAERVAARIASRNESMLADKTQFVTTQRSNPPASFE